MATNFLYGAVGTVQHLLTTELNSISDAAGCAVGPEINNTAANSLGFPKGMLSLHLASAAFTAASYVQVYFIPSTDAAGAAYPTTTTPATVPGQNYLAATIWIYGSTAAHDETKANVDIPSGKFKTILINHTGVSLASSGNTLDLYPTPLQY